MSDIKRPMGSGGLYEPNMPQEGMNQTPAPQGKGWGSKIITVIIIVVVILIGLFLVSKYTSWNVLKINKGDETATGWQAVFLTNGQVYFGKIQSDNKDTLVLSNIYYLQVSQTLQPSQGDQAQAAQQQQNLSLVKLGNELHGPKDEMKINRSQVIFTEELKSDSNVVKAIVQYVEDQANKK